MSTTTTSTKITTFANATISGFSYTENNTLKVYFTVAGAQRRYSAVAHPALRVAAHIGVAQDIRIIAKDNRWAMIQPYPTAEEIEQNKARQEERKWEEASATELALLNF